VIESFGKNYINYKTNSKRDIEIRKEYNRELYIKNPTGQVSLDVLSVPLYERVSS